MTSQNIYSTKGVFVKGVQVKDLGPLKYFLGIKSAWPNRGLTLFQRKYELDLPNKIGLLGCRIADTLMELSPGLCAIGELLSNVG